MRKTPNGTIIYKGKKVDMYALMQWLILYNTRHNTKYTFKSVTDVLIAAFLRSQKS